MAKDPIADIIVTGKVLKRGHRTGENWLTCCVLEFCCQQTAEWTWTNRGCNWQMEEESFQRQTSRNRTESKSSLGTLPRSQLILRPLSQGAVVQIVHFPSVGAQPLTVQTMEQTLFFSPGEQLVSGLQERDRKLQQLNWSWVCPLEMSSPVHRRAMPWSRAFPVTLVWGFFSLRNDVDLPA